MLCWCVRVRLQLLLSSDARGHLFNLSSDSYYQIRESCLSHFAPLKFWPYCISPAPLALLLLCAAVTRRRGTTQEPSPPPRRRDAASDVCRSANALVTRLQTQILFLIRRRTLSGICNRAVGWTNSRVRRTRNALRLKTAAAELAPKKNLYANTLLNLVQFWCSPVSESVLCRFYGLKRHKSKIENWPKCHPAQRTGRSSNWPLSETFSQQNRISSLLRASFESLFSEKNDFNYKTH